MASPLLMPGFPLRFANGGAYVATAVAGAFALGGEPPLFSARRHAIRDG